jgi:two-component system nitrogen regulation response regulator NtrX
MTDSGEVQKTVLVVDDEADIRLLLGGILGLRYQVKTAAAGLEALELIGRAPEVVDLVLTDLRMPRMDGRELLRSLRADYPDLGVMRTSAHGTVTEAVKAMRNGAFDYITKPLPLDFNEIYAKIERYFEMRELKRQTEQLNKQSLDLSYFPRSNPHLPACRVET